MKSKKMSIKLLRLGIGDWGLGPLAVANGVVFGAAFNGQMTALDAATGATL